MKATSLLEKQHRKVETLFKKLESGKTEAEPLLDELSNDLAAHMAIEQNIFYPAIREIEPDLVSESFQEHAVAEIALKRLRLTDPQDPTFQAKVVTLKELIEHHVEEEEEELFPKVEKALGAERLNALGAKMSSAFDEAVEQGFDALVPEGFDTTTADQANVISTEGLGKKKRSTTKVPTVARSLSPKARKTNNGAGAHR